MKKNKEITMDDLAIMINNGFESMTKEFKKEIKSEIGKVEERLEKVENKIGTIEGKIGYMSKEIDSLQRGQERMEDKLDEMLGIKRTVKNHDKRIVVLEKKVLLAS